jgi:hypothetical protein
MDPAALKDKLIAVLGQIQADSGLECPPLTGATKPVENLPKFDSKEPPSSPPRSARRFRMT